MLNVKKVLNLCVTTLTLCCLSFDLFATTDPLDPATNYIVTRTDTTVFTADGVNTGGTEYGIDDRVLVAGSNFMEAQVFFKRYKNPSTGDEELRIYFSVHDIDTNVNDRIDFYFDKLHNHGDLADLPAMAEDMLIRITRGNCSPATTPCTATLFNRDGTGLFVGTGTAVPLANAVVQSSNPGEYASAPVGFNLGWTGELVLNPTDLGWSYLPQVTGHLIRARSSGQNAISAANPLPSSPANPTASYPLNAGSTVSETDAILWSNLKLRYPIDFAISLDYSGSMLATDALTSNRWVRAKRAADLFAAALGIFKPEHDMLDDRISVAQYSWSCSNDAPGGDTTGSVFGVSGSPGLGSIGDPPDDGDDTLTSGNSGNNPAGNNCTPIKRGIEFALDDQLSIGTSSPNDKRDRIVLLLSDGFHNTPSADVPLNPASDFNADEKSFTQIRTVALGPDGSAGTDLLAEIATAFNGGVALSYEGKYNQTGTFEELLQAYIETLQAPLTVNLVPPVGSTYSPGAPDKLVFVRVWDDPAQATNFSIMSNASVAVPDEQYFNTEIGYAAAVFTNPTANASWQMVGVDGTDFVLADLRILARFLIEQKSYAAGDPMLLQVSLKDKGQPLLGADVVVEVAKPGEGLGNYLTLVQENCEMGEPGRPFKDAVRDDRLNASGLTHVALPSNATLAATGTQQGADPKPLKYALAAAHFERCHKEGLDKDNLPGTRLYDDGTHGDLFPDDGIYSLSFADTNLEGSYTFRFFAIGSTSDGVDFGRTRVTSQFVGIEPDAESTQTFVQAGSVVNGLATQIIYFLPQDKLGNYMGPGFHHKFKLSTSSGAMLGELVDLQNGYYAQAVQYSTQADPPVVTIETTEGCFKKVVGDSDDNPTPSDQDKCKQLLLLLLIIILLLLILLIWCWVIIVRCKRRG